MILFWWSVFSWTSIFSLAAFLKNHKSQNIIKSSNFQSTLLCRLILAYSKISKFSKIRNAPLLFKLASYVAHFYHHPNLKEWSISSQFPYWSSSSLLKKKNFLSICLLVDILEHLQSAVDGGSFVGWGHVEYADLLEPVALHREQNWRVFVALEKWSLIFIPSKYLFSDFSKANEFLEKKNEKRHFQNVIDGINFR